MEKDIAEKHFEELNEIFADIINGTLFNGEQVVKPNELYDLPARSQYKADDGELHEQERDIIKCWKRNGKIYAIFALENQTRIDHDMPIRIPGYDGASYRSQLLGKKKKRHYPVITIVLYYGKTKWKNPKSLTQCLDIPDCLKEFVVEYDTRKNLYDISHMSDKEIDNRFHSDFNILAKYMHNPKRPHRIKQKIKYPDQLLKLLSILTGDKHFKALAGSLPPGGTMSEAVDMFINEGIEKGIEKGKNEALRESAKRLFENGASFELVESSFPDLSKEELQKIFEETQKM